MLVLTALLAPAPQVYAALHVEVVDDTLTITGDDAGNVITLRLAPGDDTTVEILERATVVTSVPRARFTTIIVNGGAGVDSITIDDVNGVFTDTALTTLNGGDGFDTLTGSAGAETLDGGNDTDLLTGGAGDDTLIGGDGDDLLEGSQGTDKHFGDAGDDFMIWNPGDGSDLIEGGTGFDTLVFIGSHDDDTIAATHNAGRVSVTRNLGNVIMDVGTTETLEVFALSGNDTITIGDDLALAGLTVVSIDGGPDNDRLIGGNGAERLFGDFGNDTLIGGAGTDLLEGGDGNDVLVGGPGGQAGNLERHNGGPGHDIMIWNPGDGSDIIDGGPGADTLSFTGSNDDEIIAATANAGRMTLTRNLGNIIVDIGTTELLEVLALDGNDTITAGDGLADAGLTLVVHGGGGNDTITGGDGDDLLLGGEGNDIIAGGAGVDLLDGELDDDTIIGGPGGQPGAPELHVGGPGNDTMIWNPGDGSDRIDGGGGNDTLVFNGANADEVMAATANAGRVSFTRTPGNVVMDIGTTEHLTVNAFGGNDTINANAGLAGLIEISVDAGAGADTIASFASTTLFLNGGTEEDTLNFDAESNDVSQSQFVILVGGIPRVTHAQVEHINIVNSSGQQPAIEITQPTTDPATTSSSPLITLAGTATGAAAPSSVTWTNDRGGSGVAAGTTSWTAADIPLLPGVNILTVTVEGADGKRTSDQLAVTVVSLVYTMAEGSTGDFFDTDLLLANPNAVAAPVVITYVKGDGTTVRQDLNLAPTSRTTIEVDKVAGLEATDLSATVTSTNALPLVVERTMRWDATGYGAHTEKAANEPALTWYFAEGSQGSFDTFLLLANPGPKENVATVQFLPESGSPVTRTYTLQPTSRRTIYAGLDEELKNRSFGAIVTFTEPGMAERAMYFGQRVFDAGHESAGVTAPASEWFLAEGATGSFFTTFVLVANPGDTAGTVTYTYLPDHGAAVTKTREIGPRQRLTVNIATEDDSLASAAVATRVASTVPVLAERAQYWPFTPDQWYEAHNSFGSTSVGLKWGLAEGRVGGPQNYQTFILLANANETQASDVRVTFLRADGSTVVKTVTVNPETRLNLQVGVVAPELVNEAFGTLVEVTNGVRIFVERAMYSDAAGVVFAAGTNALATQLP